MDDKQLLSLIIKYLPQIKEVAEEVSKSVIARQQVLQKTYAICGDILDKSQSDEDQIKRVIEVAHVLRETRLEIKK